MQGGQVTYNIATEYCPKDKPTLDLTQLISDDNKLGDKPSDDSSDDEERRKEYRKDKYNKKDKEIKRKKGEGKAKIDKKKYERGLNEAGEKYKIQNNK